MDSELIDIPIDYDETKLEQQESVQESQEIVYIPNQSPYQQLMESQIKNTLKISFHLTEQISSSVLQLYENIQYTLYSQINEKPSNTVLRKYTHFEWLNAALKRELPGLIIPAVPPKNMLAKINLAERTQCVREKRFRQLDEFLRKVILNQKLQSCPKFLIFLNASPEVMQQELSEMLQYNSYAQQMGTALLNAGSKAYDMAKGSINYFSSFIYTQQPLQKQIQYPDLEIQQDIKEYFESWEDLLMEEQKKVKKIFEYFNSIVNIKLEQNEETRKIISSMRDMSVEELDKCIKKASTGVYLNESLLNEIKLHVLFKLELCQLDIDEAIGIIKQRNDIISQIQQQIKLHNQSEQFNEKLQLKEEIIRNQKLLKSLESNFQSDIKSFANWLNGYLKQLIQTYNEQFQKLYNEQNKNWND